MNHTVSLDLARKLREAGYPQEGSLFYWTRVFIKGEKDSWQTFYWQQLEFEDDAIDCIAAPIASELGERLPYYIDTKDKRGSFDLLIRKAYKVWICEYAKFELSLNHPNRQLKEFFEHALTEAMGLMMLHLLTNNLLSPSK